MTHDNPPVACSLDASGLERRLAAIGEVGARSLVSHAVDGDSHLLRFQAGSATRRRLEEIAAAEAECCPFLDLSLSEEGDELVLSISAPEEALAVAAQLAEAFSGGHRPNG